MGSTTRKGWVGGSLHVALLGYDNFIQHTTQFAYDFRPLLEP